MIGVLLILFSLIALKIAFLALGVFSRRVWQPRSRTGAPARLLLITDIGDDIDDLLALLTAMALHHLGVVRLVAVVTCGGHTLLRAATVRFWLRRLGVEDPDVVVAAGVESTKRSKPLPAVPENCQSVEHSEISPESGAQVILDMVRQHGKNLGVVAIGEMTPLAACLEIDQEGLLRQIGALYIQGQAHIQNGRLVPDDEAYNIRCDVLSASRVFAQLQDFIPFHMLGKYAAYRVSLEAHHFTHWTQSANNYADMVSEARANLNKFRKGNPALFYRLYSVPEEMQNDRDWFSSLSVYSHPYDPSLILRIVDYDEELFRIVHHRQHTMVGNSEDDHGVPRPERVASVMSRLIALSCRRIAAVAEGRDFGFLSLEH